jgi:hypothetical protein
MEVLHLKDLVVNVTTETELHFFCARPELRMRWVATTKRTEKRQPRLPLLEPGHSLTWKHYTTCTLTDRGENLPRDPRGYQLARMRYFSTEVPSLATGTMNCAAKAAVFLYL